jgi:hypothetical protein
MRKSWIIIGVTVFSIISALTVLIEFQLLDGTDQNISHSWMFKGAYAKYEGQIDSLATPSNLTAEIQVTDINASHVQIRTNSTIATSFAPALSDQTFLWVNKTDINFQPNGETLARTYNTEIIVRSIGIRNCTVYDYTNEAINATYYIDKVLLWPVRIVYTTGFQNQTYTLEFNLKDTNIKGLN